MRLGVVVGHTTDSQGAILCEPYEFVSEYEFHTLTAAYIIAVGEHEGVAVDVAFRDSDGIAGAYKYLAAKGVDAAIELHFNSFNSKTEGTETLYGNTPGSKSLAMIVQSYMATLYNRGSIQNRGIKYIPSGGRGGFNVNQPVDYPCVLVEPFFGDKIDEARRALSLHTSLAQSLVRAFKTYMKDNVS